MRKKDFVRNFLNLKLKKRTPLNSVLLNYNCSLFLEPSSFRPTYTIYIHTFQQQRAKKLAIFCVKLEKKICININLPCMCVIIDIL
jgi:hypothetical protein